MKIKLRICKFLESKAKSFLERDGYKFTAKEVQMPEHYNVFRTPQINMEVYKLVSTVEISPFDLPRSHHSPVINYDGFVHKELQARLAVELRKYWDLTKFDDPSTMNTIFQATIFIAVRKP